MQIKGKRLEADWYERGYIGGIWRMDQRFLKRFEVPTMKED